MERDLAEFFSRYPCDQRAQDFLRATSFSVVARALQEFRPPREGEADYSALLVTFVRNLQRGEPTSAASHGAARSAAPVRPSMQLRSPQLQASLEEFQQKFPMDDKAYKYIADSLPHVQSKVIRDFRPKIEGEDDYSALIISFTKRCRDSSNGLAQVTWAPPVQPTWAPPVAPRLYPQFQAYGPYGGPSSIAGPAQVDAFCRRYPIDEKAYNYLVASAMEVQRQVVSDFRPPREGEHDYSALVISVVKRCRSNAANVGMYQASAPQHGRYNAALAPAPVFRTAAPMHGAGPSLEEFEGFCERYPCDEASQTYLNNSPPGVQLQVMRNFKPKGEGEADYSALVISFTKRCRQSGPQVAMNQFAAYSPQAWQPVQLMRMVRPPLQELKRKLQPEGVAAEDMEMLQNFRTTFPMDDRAFTYLLESPAEARQIIVDTFEPKRVDDTDYSAPVVAYAKLCRTRSAEETHTREEAEMATSQSDDIGQFCERYPIDARAKDYLEASSSGVVAKVIQEFRAKREGDDDYSAAVVSFVGMCRKIAGGDSGGAAKRARMFY